VLAEPGELGQLGPGRGAVPGQVPEYVELDSGDHGIEESRPVDKHGESFFGVHRKTFPSAARIARPTFRKLRARDFRRRINGSAKAKSGE
jgi:hypothetical protein